MDFKKQITKDFKEYNKDANRNWDDEKILQLCNYKQEGGVIKFCISIGKYDTTYHDLVVKEDYIAVEKQSARNKLLETVIHHILNPIFFGN